MWYLQQYPSTLMFWQVIKSNNNSGLLFGGVVSWASLTNNLKEDVPFLALGFFVW